MNLRRLFFTIVMLALMGLPGLAGSYYYLRTAPQIDALARAEQALPPACQDLEDKLHQAFMHDQQPETYAMARSDREQGLRLCADGSEEAGILKLKAALRDIGLEPHA